MKGWLFDMRKIEKNLLPTLIALSAQMQRKIDFWKLNWDLYFGVMGFSEFAAISGHTVEQFLAIYEVLIGKIQEYYDSFDVEKGVTYCPMFAGVCLEDVGYSLSACWGVPYMIGDREIFDCAIPIYRQVSVLKDGPYFPVGPKRQLSFRTADEVMRGIITLYYDNLWFYGDSTLENRYEYFPQPDIKSRLEEFHYIRR